MNSEPEFSCLSHVHKGIQLTRTSQEDKKLLSKQIKRARMRSAYHQISGTLNNIDICVCFGCGQWLVSEEDDKNYPAKKIILILWYPLTLQEASTHSMQPVHDCSKTNSRRKHTCKCIILSTVCTTLWIVTTGNSTE